jgi:transposase
MPKIVKLRTISEEEHKELERLSRSRKAEQRLVERATIILMLAKGDSPKEVARKMGRSQPMVYQWLHRFNETGVEGLQDGSRTGRSLTYDEMERGRLIETVLTKPDKLGLGFGFWTLDRLVEYVNKELSIAISRSQLGAILKAEGLKWYQEQTYFTEGPDPQFVEQRGR